MISVVACCHGAKLCAHAARNFRSQCYAPVTHVRFQRPTYIRRWSDGRSDPRTWSCSRTSSRTTDKRRRAPWCACAGGPWAWIGSRWSGLSCPPSRHTYNLASKPKSVSDRATWHRTPRFGSLESKGFGSLRFSRFGSLESQIRSLESEKIIIGSLKSEKIGSLESEKSGP